MKYLSPLEMMYKWEEEKGNEVFLSQPINSIWHDWTWEEVMLEVRKMAAYIKSLNLEEKSKIAILSKNCAHWIMSDLAIMMSGHISVTLYPNLSADTLIKILILSETISLFQMIQMYNDKIISIRMALSKRKNHFKNYFLLKHLFVKLKAFNFMML